MSDQAKNMDGDVVRRFCSDLGIEKRRSSPYHPQGNGLAERCVQSAKQLLRCLLSDRKLSATEWPNILKEVSFVFNAAPNSSTGITPNEVMYGVKLRHPGALAVPSEGAFISPEDHVEETKHAQEETARLAEANNATARMQHKKQHDHGKVSPEARGIRVGDRVMLRREERGGLDPVFSGPYQVAETSGANVVINMPTGLKRVHMDRVKKLTGSTAAVESHGASSEVRTGIGMSPESPVSHPEEPIHPITADVECALETGHRSDETLADEEREMSACHDTAHEGTENSRNESAYDDPLEFLPARSRSGRVIRRNPRYDQS